MRKRRTQRCSVCHGTAAVQYAPHAGTIPGAAHGGRWICADCLYLEGNPDAAKIKRPTKRKRSQDEVLFGA